jgi:glycosyltransferase involved in cell wall biosynthesis
VVVSIHDLSFEHLPQTFKWRSRKQLRITVRRTARQASQVIALSEHGRNDIVDTYQVSPERKSVIPLSAGDQFRPIRNEDELQRVRQTYAIKGEYMLSVGAIQPRKNLSRLVAAYARLRHARPEVKLPKLVLAGKCAWLYDETLRTIEELQLSDSIILTGYVPQSDLPALYSGAICFIYPSYFEGFGLPPLEAMKCGVPVIVGDRTSLPEVVGDAAVLVDPFDVDALAAAIEKVISDSDLRTELGLKGLGRAKLFNWRETARQTLAVYRKAAGVAGCVG